MARIVSSRKWSSFRKAYVLIYRVKRRRTTDKEEKITPVVNPIKSTMIVGGIKSVHAVDKWW